MAERRLDFLISAVDLFSAPMGKATRSLEEAERAFRSTRAEMTKLQGALSSTEKIEEARKKIAILAAEARKLEESKTSLVRKIGETTSALERLKAEASTSAEAEKRLQGEIREHEKELERMRVAEERLGKSIDANEKRRTREAAIYGRFEAGLRRAGVNTEELAVEQRRLAEEMDKATRKAKEQGDVLDRERTRSSRREAGREAWKRGAAMLQVGQSAWDVGARVVGGVRSPLEKALSEETAAAALESTLGARMRSPEARKSLLAPMLAEARRLSVERGIPTTEVLAGMDTLAKGGFSAAEDPRKNEILRILPEAIDFAQAGDIGDVGEATKYLVSGMTAFGADVKRVGEVLVAGATSSIADVADFGTAFAYSASQAKGLGVTLEQNAALVAGLMQSGLEASTAGTGLSAVFSGLTRGGESKKALEALGVPVERDKKTRPVVDIVRDLDRELTRTGASDVERQRVYGKIFQEQGGRAALSLSRLLAPVDFAGVEGEAKAHRGASDALYRLANTDAARKELATLGVTFGSKEELFSRLSLATSKFGEKERTPVLSRVFGPSAVAAEDIAKKMPLTYESALEQIRESQGITSSIAGIRRGTLGNRVQSLQAQMENTQADLGKSLYPVVSSTIEKIISGGDWVGEFARAHPSATAALLGGAAVTGGLMGAGGIATQAQGLFSPFRMGGGGTGGLLAAEGATGGAASTAGGMVGGLGRIAALLSPTAWFGVLATAIAAGLGLWAAKRGGGEKDERSLTSLGMGSILGSSMPSGFLQSPRHAATQGATAGVVAGEQSRNMGFLEWLDAANPRRSSAQQSQSSQQGMSIAMPVTITVNGPTDPESLRNLFDDKLKNEIPSIFAQKLRENSHNAAGVSNQTGGKASFFDAPRG